MVESDMAKVAAEDAGQKVRCNLAEYLEKGNCQVIMLDKNTKIYIAGHHGLVGSAIWNKPQEERL